jgi:hypothetical protein
MNDGPSAATPDEGTLAGEESVAELATLFETAAHMTKISLASVGSAAASWSP